MLGTIIGLLSGAAGGNIAGALMKKNSLGTLWNSVAGIAGGGIGSSLLGMLGMAAGDPTAGGSLDIGSMLGMAGSGVAGGGVLMAVIGMIRRAMAK